MRSNIFTLPLYREHLLFVLLTPNELKGNEVALLPVSMSLFKSEVRIGKSEKGQNVRGH